MEELDKMNLKKEELSDEMILFIALNTASIQIIPTNLIAIRSSLNSTNPSRIIVGVWFASLITVTCVVLIAKTYIKLRKK